MASASANISKKRKHVAEGVFRAELDGYLRKELAEDGYSGVEVRITPKVDFQNFQNYKNLNSRKTVCKKIFLANWDHHPRYPNPERLGRQGQANSRTDRFGPEAIPDQGRRRRALRREGRQPRSLRYCSVRISPVQARGWSRRPTCRLRCPPIHHGVWS